MGRSTLAGMRITDIAALVLAAATILRVFTREAPEPQVSGGAGCPACQANPGKPSECCPPAPRWRPGG